MARRTAPRQAPVIWTITPCPSTPEQKAAALESPEYALFAEAVWDLAVAATRRRLAREAAEAAQAAQATEAQGRRQRVG